MDRDRSKKKNQNINIDKVVDIIGLQERMQYDKIDVFIDANNKDNVWAIVYYTEDQRKRSLSKERIIRFKDYNEMMFFVKNNFDTSELQYQVDYMHRKIFMHQVDYENIKYYLHEGKPDLNYIELEYKEYVNDGFHIRSRIIPKEYNDMLIETMKINKNIDSKTRLNWDLYQIIDVYKKSEKEDSRISRRDKRMMREESGMPMADQDKRRRGPVGKIVIGSLLAISIAIAGGYILEKTSQYKEVVVNQKKASLFGIDARIRQNKEQASVIINHLFEGHYEEVSYDDLKRAMEFINEVGRSNFDNNSSSTLFEYIDFFGSKLYQNHMYNGKDAGRIHDMLEKIENLHNNCFKQIGDDLFFKTDSAKKYINYVASLTFMYDTTVDSRNSGLVSLNSQDTNPQYATQTEIMAYNQCPSILKYIILSQLKSVLSHTDYQVGVTPSNYFGGLDKYDLLNQITTKMENIGNSLRIDCNYYSGKGK